jgi:signal transduction histidine kinase
VLAIAAHELRTPVAALAGHVQLLRRQLAHGIDLTESDVDARLAQIERQALRVGELIARLLEVARVEADKLSICRQSIDLRQLLFNVVDMVGVAAPGRQLVVDAPGPIGAEVDVVRIEQVVLNLLDNALKFSPAERPIEISLRHIHGVARLAVRDFGRGVPLDDRAHIFDRFFQAHGERRSGGLGLGLYLGRHIVELHGGHLFAEFPADGGTRFVLELHAVPRTSTASAPDGLSVGACA